MESKEKFLEWAEEALGAERREEVEIDHALAREQFAEWLNQKAVDRSPFPPVEEVHDRKTRDAFAEWFREKEEERGALYD